MRNANIYQFIQYIGWPLGGQTLWPFEMRWLRECCAFRNTELTGLMDETVSAMIYE